MKKLPVALLSFAHMHAYSYADILTSGSLDAELVAIADPCGERLEIARNRYPTVPHFFSDYRELLHSRIAEAVVITSENVHHAPMALDAFEAGMHVLCEKPLATTTADAGSMIEAAHKTSRVLMTAFPVRFSPAIACARRAIEKGELGRILGAVTTNHGSMPGGWFTNPQLSGGGAVMDHTVHVVDLLRFLFSCEAVDVYACYDTRLHPTLDCEDVGLLSLTMENGAVVTLDTSWSRCKTYPIWGDVKLEIRGEHGRLSIDCFPTQVHRYDDLKNRHEAFSLTDNLDALMIKEFIAAIREERIPLVTGEDGLRALEVALAAYKSGAEHRPVAVAELTSA
ncbi:MAG: Gfo/Idh/MocA family oxidoreductase [Candidatus Sumerlaeaceae bacterium]|nr:Gfo/Idh/MocA family oxidoreductase [Candidatus Sumerlaeaceae bacterium]